jgi:Uma2 family endonuclease
MSAASQQPMTLAAFLIWEERQESRYEFDGHTAHAMTGGTYEHDAITFNIRSTLAQRLEGKPCRPCGPNLKIIVQGKARYPDCLVTCAPIQRGATVIEEPVVVIEVISEDSARTDRIEKVREYQATASIQRYISVEQRGVGALVLARDGERWLASAATAGDTLEMPEIGIDVPLADFYLSLDLGEPPRL